MKKKITVTFEQSLDRLKNSFNKLFSQEANHMNNSDNILENEKLIQYFINNKNMKLIFEYHYIIKEIYENKIETKVVEKDYEINKIIDNCINEIKKLRKKRNIIVKDYKNCIFVIVVEMMVNKKDKQAKKFIIKKETETIKGNC